MGYPGPSIAEGCRRSLRPRSDFFAKAGQLSLEPFGFAFQCDGDGAYPENPIRQFLGRVAPQIVDWMHESSAAAWATEQKKRDAVHEMRGIVHLDSVTGITSGVLLKSSPRSVTWRAPRVTIAILRLLGRSARGR